MTFYFKTKLNRAANIAIKIHPTAFLFLSPSCSLIISGMSSSPHRYRGDGNGDSRPRFFDAKTKSICWAKADTVPGRHPEMWRKDAAGNIVCKRFFNCLGCLCYEYDHIIPFSKGSIFLPPFSLPFHTDPSFSSGSFPNCIT